MAVSDDSAAVVARYAYDAWGKRLTPAGDPVATHHGFTGHEHLDDVGLIHMNGRVYDPVLVRVMSADPIIQAPSNGQSYNRYSYVLNNPLSYIEPSGFSAWTRFRDKILKPVVIIVVAVVAAPYVAAYAGLMTGSTIAAGAAAGATVGATAGLVYNGPQGMVKGAVYGGVSGGVAGGLADFGTLGQMTGSGVNGYLQTGNTQGFVRGFAAGGIPQDLGFKDAYLNNGAANIGIGIARDGIRGAIIADSRNGIGPGIAYGQVNNAAGHLWGSISSNFAPPEFRDGVFYYSDINNLGARLGYSAITFGNVITGGEQLYRGSLTTDFLRGLDQHERGHIEQASWMGALYLPLQAASQWSGLQVFEYGPLHSFGYEKLKLLY